MKMRILVIVLALGIALLLGACGAETTPAPTNTPEPTATPTPTALSGTPAPGGVEIAMGLVNKPTGQSVAMVNGVPIASDFYMGELERQLISITGQYAVDWNDTANQAYTIQVEQQVFQQLVNLELARQLAAVEGIKVSEEALNIEVEATRTSILSSGTYTDWDNFLAVNKITEEYFRSRISDSLLVDEMIKRHGGPTTAEQVHAQHILVADEETAKKVLAELQAGKTFEDLAKEYSTDTGSKDSGGDLGWFPRGAMVEAFENAAFSQEIGIVGQPVQSDYGYHIIKVVGKETRPLEGDLLTQVQEQAFNTWFVEQRDKAVIEDILKLGQ